MGPELQSRQLPCYERCVLYTFCSCHRSHCGRQQTCIYKQDPPHLRQPLFEMWEPHFPTPTARLRDRFRLTYVSFTAARKKKRNLTSPTHLQNFVSGKLHGMRLVVATRRPTLNSTSWLQAVSVLSFICVSAYWKQFAMSLLITMCRHLLRYTAAYLTLMQLI
jgi:hypothetical protein